MTRRQASPLKKSKNTTPTPAALRHKTAFPAAAALLASLCILTFSRNMIWHDSIVLWEDVVAKSPRKAKARNNLAFAYSAEGEIDRAIDHYRSALLLEPDNASAHFNLGVIYIGRGYTNEAAREFETALRLDPYLARARWFLEFIYKEGSADSRGGKETAHPKMTIDQSNK